MATNKSPFTDDQRRELQPIVVYCKSSIGFEEILRDEFPKLGAYFLEHANELRNRKCESGLEALITAVVENTPMVSDIVAATFDHSARKRMRDRFLKAVANAYDVHFPKPGGRLANPKEAHEAALERAAGLSWGEVSTRGGRHVVEDQSRKAVARDREILMGAFLCLTSIAGPESDAPGEIKTELERFRRVSNQRGSNPRENRASGG
jgi:hypothetical protein